MKTILLTGMPRSGTSWLSQIFDSNTNVRFKLDPIFSYAFKNSMDESSTKEEWSDFFDQVYNKVDPFLDQNEKRSTKDYPIFKDKEFNPEFLVIKTTRFHHLLPSILKNTKTKIIHIVRHPCGAINSWLKSTGEFPSDADPLSEWKSGKCRKTSKEEYWGFDDWCLTTLNALSLEMQYPDRVKVVSYDNLVDDPNKITLEMFEFTGLDFCEQTNSFLNDCHSKHVKDQYAVFKPITVKDSWKEELDPTIQKAIINSVNKDGQELNQFIL